MASTTGDLWPFFKRLQEKKEWKQKNFYGKQIMKSNRKQKRNESNF